MFRNNFHIIILLSVLSVFLNVNVSSAQSNNWEGVDKILGNRGTIKDGVYKITFPRTDLKVTIGSFPVSAGLALTSWVGFIKMDNMTMMMGDLVLTDKEEPAVLKKLISENLNVTALHNHLIGETPPIKYIHFSGNGNAEKLAQEIKNVLSVTGTPLEIKLNKTETVSPDWSKAEAILGTTGKHNGNLLQYSFPRKEKLTESGMEMPAYMGMATGINFQMSGNQTAITGDFVLLADEVNKVAKALIENNINVTAIHNHMLFDNPRLFMLHFWAVGDAGVLAKGLKAALDKTNSIVR